MINKCHRIDKEQAKNNGLTAITCFPTQQNDATLQRRAAECRAEKSPAWQDKEMGVRVDGGIGIKDKETTTREGASNASRWGIGVSAETKLWQVDHRGLVVWYVCDM